jgi:hypothetical protein
MPEVFSFLMRQQNADMLNNTEIPIFGYTPDVRNQQIEIDNEKTTIKLAMATTPEIIRIEATPSSWNLHKYLVVVKKNDKETAQKKIQNIFGKIKHALENQPENFPLPRCGGRENYSQTPMDEYADSNVSTYVSGLETLALANPQDAGPSEPPKRYRKFTISYASATKMGILKQSQSTVNAHINNTQTHATNTTQDSTSTTTTTQ